MTEQTQTLADGKLVLDYPAERVARLTIRNLAKRNALDHAILDAIAETLPQLKVRCLILTGCEGMFSSGYDIGDIPDDVFAREAEKLVAHPFTAALEALERFPYPTLAALTGHTIGGGLELAISCDLRVAAPAIKLGMPPAKLGLVYSHTGLRKFLNEVGPGHTRELFFTGRNIGTEQALSWGLINEVVQSDQLEQYSVDLAAEIAANAPLSLKGNKHVINSLLAASDEIDSALEAELITLRKACFESNDFREGVKAFAQKRPANWTGS